MTQPEPAAEVEARPAATVLLLRDRPGGGIEVHMQQRRAEMDFGGLAYVFPGGSMDRADGADAVLAPLRDVDLSPTAARMHLDGSDDARRLCAALHICAVREVFEEAGVLLAVDATGGADFDSAALAAGRARVLGGGDLGSELAALGARARVEALTYAAHFITPRALPRRYDTRFFAARAPERQEAAHHAGEATSGEWVEPAEMIARQLLGEVILMAPTRILLEEVRRHRDVDAALTELGSRPVATILFSMRDLARPLPDHLPGVEEIAAMERELS